MTGVTTFYITNFQIDLSRSVVITGETETQVEPKVLKVLALLARRQNEVVTHQEIMDQVWQGTEVVPNALQRCIAILRKVLGDDAKSPTIIATHPRIGYRLLAEVRWPAGSDGRSVSSSMTAEENKTKQTGLSTTAIGLTTVVVLMLVVLINKFWPSAPPDTYIRVQALTQTDAHETHALFSPNAQYIVFNRYAGACKSHIWARHLAGGQEHKLTSRPGYFGATSFTADGRELVFAAKEGCDSFNTQPDPASSNSECWSIATLDFSLALSAPMQPSFRYQCQAERLETPKALPNHQYAFLQYEDKRYRLMHFDDLRKALTPLYAPKQAYLYHFDYDPLHRRFAVISRDSQFNHTVEILDESGQSLSREIIQRPKNMSVNQTFDANFEPQGEYLLAVSNNRLYKIEFNGKLQEIKTPEANLISAVQHPKGRNLVAVAGHKDIDIGRITLGEKNETQPQADLNNRNIPFASLTRTKAQERLATFQPDGEAIAFVSDRSGQAQLWLLKDDEASQLTFNASQQPIHNYSWSPDGKQLAWVSDDKLAITDLNGEVQLFHTEKPLHSVLSWYGKKQLLVLINDPQPGGLYRLDLEQNRLIPFGVNLVEAAWVHHNQLIYSDINGQVFTRPLNRENSEITRLAPLNGKALFIKEDVIYSVDPESLMLNRYSLQGQLLKPVMPLKATAWKITDLKDKQLLLSQFIAINHEIVMLQ